MKGPVHIADVLPGVLEGLGINAEQVVRGAIQHLREFEQPVCARRDQPALNVRDVAFTGVKGRREVPDTQSARFPGVPDSLAYCHGDPPFGLTFYAQAYHIRHTLSSTFQHG